MTINIKENEIDFLENVEKWEEKTPAYFKLITNATLTI